MILSRKYVSKIATSFYPMDTCLLVEGQEFNEQSRTLLFYSEESGKFSIYVKFPKLHFCKYSLLLEQAGLPHNMYFYTMTGYVDNTPVYLHLPDVSYKNGMVGLGGDLGNEYINKIEIDLDDFIERFWLSRFNGKGLQNYSFDNLVTNHLSLNYPHLWSQEIPKGWALWTDDI